MEKSILETANFLNQFTGNFKPEIGVILGTGLGKLVEEIEIHHEIPYDKIPGFVEATVEFHKPRLIFGTLAGKKVVCMQGRFHYYEGYDMLQITFPVRVMKVLGIETLIVSNAAGGLNPTFAESNIMIIEDHISLFLPDNPLRGINIMGDRFPDMSEPYETKLVNTALEIARNNKLEGVTKGVYVSVGGPQLETRSEYRLLRNLGADAVGMSTVPEVIVANQMGLKVFGVSVITDMCIPETLKKAEISKILEAAAKAEPKMTFLIKELIKEI